MDTFQRWLDALDARYMHSLSFQEVRRSVQALSSLYVERRDRIGHGSALDGAGKRAAFASYFAPLHFLLVRHVVRALGAAHASPSTIMDVGCGTGAAGAAWALEAVPPARLVCVDRSSWAIQEARWTIGTLGLQGSFQTLDVSTLKVPGNASVIAAFAMNELSDEARDRWQDQLIQVAARGGSVLILEPIARRLSPWWDNWSRQWERHGGRSDEWRFRVPLPDPIALMDKAAGLDHRELTARSLWLPQKHTNSGNFPHVPVPIPLLLRK